MRPETQFVLRDGVKTDDVWMVWCRDCENHWYIIANIEFAANCCPYCGTRFKFVNVNGDRRTYNVPPG